jgi:hypothetical protein
MPQSRCWFRVVASVCAPLPDALASDETQAPGEFRTGCLLLVPSKRLVGTAGDVRIRGRAGAPYHIRIPYDTASSAEEGGKRSGPRRHSE